MKPSIWPQLTEEQRQWVRDNYATTRKKVIAEKFGVSESLVRKWGILYGMKTDKSTYGFHKGVWYPRTLSPEKIKRMYEKSSKTARETFRREKARVLFGLPQKTRWRVVRMPNGKYNSRYVLKKYGYILLDNSKNTFYYDEHTRRSARREANAAKYDIKILPLPENIDYGTDS